MTKSSKKSYICFQLTLLEPAAIYFFFMHFVILFQTHTEFSVSIPFITYLALDKLPLQGLVNLLLDTK